MVEVEVGQNGKKVTIWRTRRATPAERKKDKSAKTMAEVITVVFGKDKPKVTVNNTLCEE